VIPSSELRTKHNVACEIREMLETVRDSDSTRALPYLVQALVDLLRSGEPFFQKDSTEYQFRRVLFETLNRLPVNDVVKSKLSTIWACMLHILRHDNEENGTTACKTLVDLVRGYRVSTEENVSEFVAIFQEAFSNMKGLVNQYLSDDSSPLDQNVSLPALRSFKVLGEMAMVMVIMSQVNKSLVSTAIQGTTLPALEVLALECSPQHTARTDYEAMGGVWAGMCSGLRNPGMYSDFIHAQIKASVPGGVVSRFSLHLPDVVLSCLCDAFLWRNCGFLRGNSCFKCTATASRLPCEWYSFEKGTLHMDTTPLFPHPFTGVDGCLPASDGHPPSTSLVQSSR